MADRRDVLSDLDFFSRLLSAFPLLHEPASEPTPVVAIQYSANFKFVMGLYNSLSEMNRNQQLPADLSASWLVALAYTIQTCAPHYGAWQQRREVVMDAERFTAAAIESATFFMSEAAAAESANGSTIDLSSPDADFTRRPISWRGHSISKQLAGQTNAPNASTPEPVNVSVLATSSLNTVDRARLALLLPSGKADFATASTTAGSPSSSSSTPAYSAWHAARWELRQCEDIAKRSHKNFQIWHHRKELIAFAQQQQQQHYQQQQEDGASSSTHTTFTSATDVLFKGTPTPIAFADIDDRTLCDDVLLKQDSKNYHVWQHRAWFVSAFPFLHSVDVLKSLNNSFGGVATPSATSTTTTTASSNSYNLYGTTIPLYHATLDNGRRMPRGMTFEEAPLQAEIDYSSILITEDVYNNSAWGYRMHLLERYVMPKFEELLNAPDNNNDTTTTTIITAFIDLILEELSYSATQSAKEVCNECPFVYARGICNIYKNLVEKCLATKKDVGKEEELASVLAEVLKKSLGSSSRSAADTPLITITTSELATVMHRSLAAALAADVMPIVLQVREECKDANTPYGKRTEFVKLNTHQCEAVLYHIGTDVVGACWESLVRKAAETTNTNTTTATADVEAAKKAIVDNNEDVADSIVLDGEWTLGLAALDDATFAQHLIFSRNKNERDLNLKIGNSMHTIKGSYATHTDATTLVAHERACLQLAKTLYKLDKIRAKYWRFEIKRVAYREDH